MHKHLFLGPVAADISNLARDVLEADRVTVELYPRLKKKVIAVSNVDEPNRRGAMMQVQRLIFDYVRDRQVPVVIDREAAKQLVSDPGVCRMLAASPTCRRWRRGRGWCDDGQREQRLRLVHRDAGQSR